MQLTCFSCNATGSIEAFIKDDAAGELINLAGTLQPSLWRVLLGYIGLFRTSRKLPFDKALKLAKEVLALDIDMSRLEIALGETVEALRNKAGAPLKNHNYLKRVLENTSLAAVSSPVRPRSGNQSQSRRNKAIDALAEWSYGDWLRTEIGLGLSALIVRGLKNQPGADVITLTADTWHLALVKRCTVEQVDAERVRIGFERLLEGVLEWPQPKLLIDLMPPRSPRAALPAPKPTEEEYKRGAEELKKIKDSLK